MTVDLAQLQEQKSVRLQTELKKLVTLKAIPKDWITYTNHPKNQIRAMIRNEVNNIAFLSQLKPMKAEEVLGDESLIIVMQE